MCILLHIDQRLLLAGHGGLALELELFQAFLQSEHLEDIIRILLQLLLVNEATNNEGSRQD